MGALPTRVWHDLKQVNTVQSNLKPFQPIWNDLKRFDMIQNESESKMSSQGGHQGRSETVAGPSWGALGAPESFREAILGAAFAVHARGPPKVLIFDAIVTVSHASFFIGS